MTKTKLNILPAPTFARLGVNYTERETAELEKETITVPDGTQKYIIQFMSLSGETRAAVGKNAKLTLVRIFPGGQSIVSRLAAALEDNASLELVQLCLGGDTVSEIKTALNGYKASFTADLGYDLGTGDRLDINLTAEHCGRKSTSRITAGGVLRSDAQKTFKGTIDLKKGASGSVGAETEDVLLLDEAVVNKTVPVILCAEEDVSGSHGATIGRIDERHIFYMKSRGIPEEKIYELITRGRLSRVIEKIGDEQAQKRIQELLGWGDEIEQS